MKRRSRDVPVLVQTPHGHKEELCRLGNERTNQQTCGLNQVTAQAALATVLNPEWQALMANMARNMANN